MRYFRLVNAELFQYRDMVDTKKTVLLKKGDIVKARTPMEVEFFERKNKTFVECSKDGTLHDRPESIFGMRVRPVAVFKFRRGRNPEPAADKRMMDGTKLRVPIKFDTEE